jgi:RimJ/RimL family protein N-acetyltransferase
MDVVFETPRLRAGPLRPGDFEAVLRLQSDPEVMRFIREPETRPEEVHARMDLWERYAAENPGFGVLALRIKETGAFAGYGVVCTVLFDPGREIEISYVLAPAWWGRGLGTEAARGLSDYAFEKLNAPRVVAYADAGHAASHRVLEKAGFDYIGQRDDYAVGDAYFVKRYTVHGTR